MATAAMLRIDSNETLHQLGWKLLLQVHDEVILEGPEDSAAEAPGDRDRLHEVALRGPLQ